MSDALMMNGNDRQSSIYGEFHLTLNLPGSPEFLRERLAYAAKKLGYRIISEEPLIARRSGFANRTITATTLDYDRTLSFRFNSAGTNSTTVTFNYTGYPLNHRYARIVIAREAEAIAALAAGIEQEFACLACGTLAVGEDSRFCRACGAAVSSEPAELQLVRTLDSAHAGTRDLLIGVAGLLLAVITFALIFSIKGMSGLTAAIGFALMWLAPGLFWTVMGFRHLLSVLNLKHASKTQIGEKSGSVNILPPPKNSVTENTTKFFETSPEIKEHLFVESNQKVITEKLLTPSNPNTNEF